MHKSRYLQESSVTAETFETIPSPLNEVGMVNGEEGKTSGKSGEMSWPFPGKPRRGCICKDDNKFVSSLALR